MVAIEVRERQTRAALFFFRRPKTAADIVSTKVCGPDRIGRSILLARNQ